MVDDVYKREYQKLFEFAVGLAASQPGSENEYFSFTPSADPWLQYRIRDRQAAALTAKLVFLAKYTAEAPVGLNPRGFGQAEYIKFTVENWRYTTHYYFKRAVLLERLTSVPANDEYVTVAARTHFYPEPKPPEVAEYERLRLQALGFATNDADSSNILAAAVRGKLIDLMDPAPLSHFTPSAEDIAEFKLEYQAYADQHEKDVADFNARWPDYDWDSGEMSDEQEEHPASTELETEDGYADTQVNDEHSYVNKDYMGIDRQHFHLNGEPVRGVYSVGDGRNVVLTKTHWQLVYPSSSIGATFKTLMFASNWQTVKDVELPYILDTAGRVARHVGKGRFKYLAVDFENIERLARIGDSVYGVQADDKSGSPLKTIYSLDVEPFVEELAEMTNAHRESWTAMVGRKLVKQS